ncbi:ubinuclein-1 isoform X2 [Spodoptera frugiperda]|uniref:Ubinuclein-1 isoform X2 n=1 Tax=Spodoptera frugiperda TaxID=7108 RepID=A0A9R0D707_SPOFR|nr:ubinuclein-1 isoform X2 [Spodoptera frugiperda]
MSDPKRATLITVGAPKSAKNNVNKTVRLTINLDESNESKYPELNYKELVIAEERKKKVDRENGKTTAGLDPFSESNDDVVRVARQFEQKYGGKSTYGRKGRSKHDDFADIGAGYDENDSFIDNTHGYDEMIPPECDTLHGGFYINCGSLEFKSVADQSAISDAEPGGSRRNKRRISSSSSEEDSSDRSSSESSQDEKDPKAIANGDVDSHKTEHRKKKNKKIDKKTAKKVRRTDSSAATSGKQTSDDNAHGDGESADSHTSQSDSLTSKPTPSSENAATSDSSRDTETKVEVKLPAGVVTVLESLESFVTRQLAQNPNTPRKQLLALTDEYIIRLEQVVSESSCEPRVVRACWARAARALATSRGKLLQRARARAQRPTHNSTIAQATSGTNTANSTALSTSTTVTNHNNKRKADDDLADFDPDNLTDGEREALLVETLFRLKALIDEKKPAMIANYNAECERVQEERKKIQIASAAEGVPVVEKRLPKRRFPWCARTRALLARATTLAGDHASRVLIARVLPLFPQGFVRMPTLLRQADVSKQLKATDTKRPRLGSTSQPAAPSQRTEAPPAAPRPEPTPAAAVVPAPAVAPAAAAAPASFTEPIHFPSSLTVTTTTTKQSPDKIEAPVTAEDKAPYKTNSLIFGSLINPISLSKDLIVDKKDSDKKEELYIPPNNIGSITITPVPSNPPKPEKKLTNNNVQASTVDKSGLIRVKSPAALNEMVKKDKVKKPEKSQVKEKRVDSPLHVDTSYQPSKKDPSPKHKEEIPQKQIESMRVSENNIPRPALVPVHHSPTFAKPDKRPPEVKRKKDVVIISDVDPLSEQEPVAVDDSSSDVELVEDNRTDKSESKRDKSETVPSKDRVNYDANKKVNNVKCKKDKEVHKSSESEEPTNDDIDTLMRNLREMEHSQEPTKFNSNSYGGVITNVKHERSSSQPAFPRGAVFEARDRDKLTHFFEQNGWM